MEFKKAVYTPSKNSDFAGNPYIETLPARLSAENFWEKVNDLVEIPEDFEDLDVETLEQKSSNIMKSVSPTSQYYDVYCDFLNILKEGLAERNPCDVNTKKWQNQVATGKHIRARTTAPSIKFTGYSGMGKTTLIDSVLTLIEPVFFHPKEGPLEEDTLQMVYIKIDIPPSADSKEICLIIAAEVDKVFKTDYVEQYEKLRRTRCIKKIVTLCSSLLIGVIIFDEIHNLCFTAPNERAMIFMLFDQLTQVARIPTVKIGTSKANRLAEKEFSNARRLGIPHEWRNFKKESTDWKSLVNYAWEYQLTPGFVELTDSLRTTIYQLTWGIPHCLFFLIEQTNKYCLRKGINSFSKEILEQVFDDKFSIMKPAIIALRHRKVDAFDDIMSLDNQLDKEVKKLIKNLLKIADDNKFTGDEAKAIYEQVERYLPEYKLTKKEEQTVKRLEKQTAMISSDLPVDGDGYEGVPL